MQQPNSRSKRAKLLAGALIGTVISLGAVADSASASTPTPTKTSVVSVSQSEGSTGGWTMSMRSGIRW